MGSVGRPMGLATRIAVERRGETPAMTAERETGCSRSPPTLCAGWPARIHAVSKPADGTAMCPLGGRAALPPAKANPAPGVGRIWWLMLVIVSLDASMCSSSEPAPGRGRFWRLMLVLGSLHSFSGADASVCSGFEASEWSGNAPGPSSGARGCWSSHSKVELCTKALPPSMSPGASSNASVTPPPARASASPPASLCSSIWSVESTASAASAWASHSGMSASSSATRSRNCRFSSSNSAILATCSSASCACSSPPDASSGAAATSRNSAVPSSGTMMPASSIFAAKAACANRPRASPTVETLSCKVTSKPLRFARIRPMLSSTIVACRDCFALDCSAWRSTWLTLVAILPTSRSPRCSRRLADWSSLVTFFFASASSFCLCLCSFN
mmetsp:Transcript_18938/g.54269  ORF Transcript_18938/g.54269 Transcript_18938/m.54269 type:complete len:387 (+) Transcript_18938:455-1615(+)